MTEFLRLPAQNPVARLLLAHGAGAPMDSPFLNQMADLLAARGIETWRFEFPYMAARRVTGVKRPAPKAETLIEAFPQAVAALQASTLNTTPLPLLIGGKSMGGRIATMVADGLYSAGDIKGCVCLGYPFHPPNQPQTWRVNHLGDLKVPMLLVQGERDPFGSKAEVVELATRRPFAEAITFSWIGDGDHDFGPRGGSGFTRKGNLTAAADVVSTFTHDAVSAP